MLLSNQNQVIFFMYIISTAINSSRKYLHSPHRRDWNFLVVGFWKANKFKEMEFLVVGGAGVGGGDWRPKKNFVDV